MNIKRSRLLSAGMLSISAILASSQAQSSEHNVSSASIAPTQTITLAGALRAIDAAKAEAARLHVGGVIAVVDQGGNLVALERIDSTFAAGANISIGKARTAAIFKKPTRAFEEIIAKGRTAMTALPDFTPLQGGVPIVVGGEVIGAIGVSGASSAQQDEELAIIAANAVDSPSDSGESRQAAGTMPMSAEVTYLSAEEVNSAFSVGRPLLENNEFKIHASRRERPGQAEVHLDETDIVYVVSGSAEFVTGGTVVNGATTAPGEIRGDSIVNGNTQILNAGDVVVVPAGIPHWFKDLSGGQPFTYFVVKPITSH